MGGDVGFFLLLNEIEDIIIEGMFVDFLYVYLVVVLYRWICMRCFLCNMVFIEGIKEDEFWKFWLDVWNEIVVIYGFVLFEVIDIV